MKLWVVVFVVAFLFLSTTVHTITAPTGVVIKIYDGPGPLNISVSNRGEFGMPSQRNVKMALGLVKWHNDMLKMFRQ